MHRLYVLFFFLHELLFLVPLGHVSWKSRTGAPFLECHPEAAKKKQQQQQICCLLDAVKKSSIKILFGSWTQGVRDQKNEKA